MGRKLFFFYNSFDLEYAFLYGDLYGEEYLNLTGIRIRLEVCSDNLKYTATYFMNSRNICCLEAYICTLEN